jgi:hypothetical protein
MLMMTKEMRIIVLLVLSQSISSFVMSYSTSSSKTRLYTSGDNNRNCQSEHQCGSESSSIKDDLYIVGCGTLGKLIAKKWLEKFPSAYVVGETSGKYSHEELTQLGIHPTTREDRFTFLSQHVVKEKEKGDHHANRKFANVVFCVPPSKFSGDQYGLEVEQAIHDCWQEDEEEHDDTTLTKRRGRGGFVFTSSGGVYAHQRSQPATTTTIDGGYIGLFFVNETSEVDASSSRVQQLLAAEQVTMKNKGCVVRLAGL